ncbi:MAG: ETC complex I subunit [Pseudomonadota bacterium]
MLARIYKPAKTAMQSGTAKTDDWVLEFVPSSARVQDPLMGWTGSSDTQTQVQLKFDSAEAAKAYARKHGIGFRVQQPKTRKHRIRPGGYGDNFAHNRRGAWTH